MSFSLKALKTRKAAMLNVVHATVSNHSSARTIVLNALCLSFIGCGQADQVKMFPVSGTVTLEGQPLAEAYVTFFPEQGPRADGSTDASGRFVLMTHRENDGAVIGNHRIAISKLVPISPSDPYAKLKTMIPEKYNSPATSGLLATVKDVEMNEITFDLQK